MPEILNELMNSVQPNVSAEQVLKAMYFTMLMSAIMYLTFKYCRKESNYDRSFNITLVMIANVVTFIMILLQYNIALSIGMMGSLSIVRFRTNTKDPRDLGFVFWSMAIGLSSATGFYGLGVFSSVVLAVLMLVTGDRGWSSNTMLLVIRGENADLVLINENILRNSPHAFIKAENLLGDSFEIIYEINAIEKRRQKLIEHLQKIPGVESVNLLAISD